MLSGGRCKGSVEKFRKPGGNVLAPTISSSSVVVGVVVVVAVVVVAVVVVESSSSGSSSSSSSTSSDRTREKKPGSGRELFDTQHCPGGRGGEGIRQMWKLSFGGGCRLPRVPSGGILRAAAAHGWNRWWSRPSKLGSWGGEPEVGPDPGLPGGPAVAEGPALGPALLFPFLSFPFLSFPFLSFPFLVNVPISKRKNRARQTQWTTELLLKGLGRGAAHIPCRKIRILVVHFPSLSLFLLLVLLLLLVLPPTRPPRFPPPPSPFLFSSLSPFSGSSGDRRQVLGRGQHVEGRFLEVRRGVVLQSCRRACCGLEGGRVVFLQGDTLALEP